MERREFLLKTGRYALFGTLAAVSALSIKRSGRSAGGQCTLNNYCRECGIIQRCDLPEAIRERSASNEITNP
jgi:hypothetical protein